MLENTVTSKNAVLSQSASQFSMLRHGQHMSHNITFAGFSVLQFKRQPRVAVISRYFKGYEPNGPVNSLTWLQWWRCVASQPFGAGECKWERSKERSQQPGLVKAQRL